MIVIDGEKVRKIRISRQLTQHKLAVKTDLHDTYVSKIENSKLNGSYDLVKKLAEALGVTPEDITSEI